MSKTDERFKRIQAIVGSDDEDMETAVGRFFEYLKAHLQLPCEVRGIEDFQWEEPYVLGGLMPEEYRELKKTQPSYTDRFELLSIEPGEDSEWMLCPGGDLAANVRRAKDGKEFVLGLSELRAKDRNSPNFRLLDD